jgi:hypothetical protein
MRVRGRGRGRGGVAGVAAAVLMVAFGAPAGGSPSTASVNAYAAGASMVGPNATVPPAHCGRGSVPEHGVQGEVPLKDRNDGRSQLGYRCNLVEVGHYQGIGAGWQNAWYGSCDYYDTAQNVAVPGVQVINDSNPKRPKPTTTLTTPAMLGPWESLKVNQKRGLLAGVAAYDAAGQGPLFFDVYDVRHDCAHPKLLSSTPMDIPVGHEGNWSADGRTYYASSLSLGTATAIDVTNPTDPKFLGVIKDALVSHGLSTSDDGKLLYSADLAGANGGGNGLEIYDVAGFQSRSDMTTPPELVGGVYWTDGGTAQVPIPVYYGKRPFILFVDEGAGTTSDGTSVIGAARLIDVGHAPHPKIVSVLRLAIQSPKHAAQASADSQGDGSFTYDGHYCGVDREHNPTAAACGYFESGIRVFDIRNPYHPREIAYFNPPAQVQKHGQLQGSEHAAGFSNPGGTGVGQPTNLTADWCSSQVRFVHAKDGSWELWAQCQDNGFMTLKFTNRAYPLPTLTRN